MRSKYYNAACSAFSCPVSTRPTAKRRSGCIGNEVGDSLTLVETKSLNFAAERTNAASLWLFLKYLVLAPQSIHLPGGGHKQLSRDSQPIRLLEILTSTSLYMLLKTIKYQTLYIEFLVI